ncbi:hypothetical protein C8Q74DRAFT_263593 [Fomes fomentarius]|nr:hypothetical protein C8Q74DRAFT_263593 [Fomes fomentarius]
MTPTAEWITLMLCAAAYTHLLIVIMPNRIQTHRSSPCQWPHRNRNAHKHSAPSGRHRESCAVRIPYSYHTLPPFSPLSMHYLVVAYPVVSSCSTPLTLRESDERTQAARNINDLGLHSLPR